MRILVTYVVAFAVRKIFMWKTLVRTEIGKGWGYII